MKKLIALVVIFSIVFSSITSIFAFEDVPDNNKELTRVIEFLSALGILNGYDDGKFKPETKVKRAEMAKMLVIASGHVLESEGVIPETKTFVDCQKHWAEGYISLANDLGIVSGRGNGIFDPDGLVTYEEAVSMTLRTLGYTNEALNGGKDIAYNSAQYKTKASELGLFGDGAPVLITDAANRGDIALMLDVSLKCPMVTTGKNGTPEPIIDANGKNVALVSKLATVNNTLEVTLSELDKGHNVDLSDYLYQSITAYMTGDKVIYVVKSNSKTYEGILLYDENSKTLKINDTVIPVNAEKGTIKAFVNGEEISLTIEEIYKMSGNTVKIIIEEKGILKALVGNVFDVGKLVTNSYVSGKTKFMDYDLPLDANLKVDFNKIEITGDATSLEDIEVNDVIEVAQNGAGKPIKIIVTRDTVEGKITKIDAGKYYINGEAYVSLEGVRGLELSAEGTFYLDSKGKIVAFRKSNKKLESVSSGGGDNNLGNDNDEHGFQGEDFLG